MFIDPRISAFRRNVALTVAFLLLLIPAAGRAAASLTPAAIAARLQKTYDKTTSMTADFRQTTTIRLNRKTRKGSGKVVFKKPGLMRWDYLAPDQQVLVSNGETISMYFAKQRQMIVSPAREYMKSDVTFSFFAGTGNILRDFKVYPPDEGRTAGADQLIKLVPNEFNAQVESLYVWADNDTSLIKRLQIVDQLGSVTDIFFTNVKLNQDITSDLFSFSPPPDTEIIRQ